MSDTTTIDGQVLRGLLDTLVMGVLREGPGYGFGIHATLERELGPHAPLVKMETLYPLLHRLEAKGLLASHSAPGDRGRPRRYYRLTASGIEFLGQRLREWNAVADLLHRTILSERAPGAVAPFHP